jgi:hypothetical protein
MGLLQEVSGVGTAVTIWRKVRVGLRHPSAGWFGQRFVMAATVVVERWGPRWAKRRVGARAPIGAWLLVVAWIAAAVILTSRLW